MRFDLRTCTVAVCFAIAGMGSSFAAGGISDFIVKPSKLNQGSPIKTSKVEDKDIPDWLRKSERLEAMLGDDGKSRIENAKVVSKVETPIPGLDGFVVQADVFNDKFPDGKKDLFVFYSDKSKRYLFVGMLIDMEKERDLNMMTERYVRGQLADNPAKALRPQDMHGILIAGGKTNKNAPLQFVVDLGHENGKSSLLNVVRLHKSLLDSGKNPRPLRVVLVSGGKDEMSTGAMAMAMGYQKISGDGLTKLIEYAEQGRSTPWMSPARLKNDPNLKQAMGIGIFQIEDNSGQAMLAKLDTLPLIYDGTGDKTKYIVLPTGKADWTQLLTKP